MTHDTPPSSTPSDGEMALAALDAVGELALVRGGDGRVSFVNHAFLAAFGGSRADWTGRWFAIAPAARDGGGARRYDSLMRTRSGMRWIEWDERPMPGAGSIVMGRDVTARRADDEARAQEESAKARFFASVTHELRTPLSGALGMARLLGQTPLKSDQREYLRAIKETTSHGLDLIDEILDLSRIEAGKLELRPEPMCPATVARQVIELLTPRAEQKGLALAAVIDETAPEEVLADLGRIKQILFNLVGNGVKYTLTGGVRLDVSGDRDADGRSRLVFAVRDTGPGISEPDQAGLFEQFERGAAEREGRESGTGLGLAMVKRLAEAMHGEVGFESRPGEGSSFWASLPLPVRKAASADRPLAGETVHVAAGNPLLRAALADQVRALGAKADTIASPDRLAGLTGGTLLVDAAWVEQARANRADRTLALTDAAGKDALKAHPPAGISGWLVTPVRRASLVRFIAGQAATLSGDDPAQSRALPLMGLRILVAEDDPVNALIAEKTLSRLGAMPERACDGAEALDRIRLGGLDGALLDMRMPELDGPGVARAVRAERLNIPLVALTANATDADRQTCLAAGMDDFLAKPVNPEALTKILNALCRGQKRLRLVAG
ncbi:MAG: hybrid sensor histidine kinase/response regulator [Maricaulis sp.]|jgi:signal transduction histidine kinase/CheY-like chemotaxis protein|nr:hybrid sensor histidine kinase/response regulator [Maricaulis sp.]HAQ35431.1 hybrid sensor histidine kinase/response regulator [Alphaproteobacteria bacterium]